MSEQDVVKLIRIYRDGSKESLSGKEFEKFAEDDGAVCASAYIHGVKYRKVKWKKVKKE